MKTEKIYTDTKYVKRHFLNTLNKPYLNKNDKEFLKSSFEVLENHINKHQNKVSHPLKKGRFTTK
tara:strand:+ start:2726 stop:2920 length:195 start_codon:yes stop_codon:yes gene_type:complete